MDNELRKEYEKILTAVVLECGSLRWGPDDQPGAYAGAVDYRKSVHLRTCAIVSTGAVNEEVTWTEFSGTWASTDACRRYGVSVADVTCACGELTNREVLWEATYPDVASAVFEKMYEMLKEK